MKNYLQFNKGFGLIQIIAIVAVLAFGAVYFTQKGSKSTDVTAPTITLVSPNGGETLTIGSSTTVAFTTTGEIKDGYKVVIWLDEGAAPLATIGATTTSYSLTIPTSILIGGDAVAPLEAGSYKIRVALYDGVPCTGHCLPSDVKELANDSSDEVITIKKTIPQPVVSAEKVTPKKVIVNSAASSQPSITVLSPNGGEAWKIGSEQKVSWDLKGNVPVGYWTLVTLDSPKGALISLSTSTVNSLAWKIPNYVVQGDLFGDMQVGPHKIVISIYDNRPCYGYCVDPQTATGKLIVSDESNSTFTITNSSTLTASSQPSITVLLPNGGQTIPHNVSSWIEWNYNGLDQNDEITLGFRSPDESVCWYESATPIKASSKRFDYIPEKVRCAGNMGNLKTGKYKIQLVVKKYDTGLGVSDTSDDYFTITNLPRL
jgi:hypothetical protein